jgi:hypothetical protein
MHFFLGTGPPTWRASCAKQVNNNCACATLNWSDYSKSSNDNRQIRFDLHYCTAIAIIN